MPLNNDERERGGLVRSHEERESMDFIIKERKDKWVGEQVRGSSPKTF